MITTSYELKIHVFLKYIVGVKFTTEMLEEDFPGAWGLPTLDSQWRLQDQEGGGKRKIDYLFFKKPVSSSMVTPYRSAQPLNGKVATLSQDVVRLLSNCEKGTDHSDVMYCMEKFTMRLQRSGYPVELARRIMRSGIISYERRLRRELAGAGRIHRPEEEGK